MPENPWYIADTETTLEMTRLVEQGDLITRHISGLLPSNMAAERIRDVLDLGCGPGGWALAVARAYPHLEVTGIDRSPHEIAFAQYRAGSEPCTNAHYTLMDFQQLAFPDASFDMVNARLVQWFLPNERRGEIVREWNRVLRSGGVIRLIESELVPITNSPALERHGSLFLQALSRLGKLVSPGGYHAGISLVLRPLLTRLGCVEIRETAQLLNFSAGMPDREGVVEDIRKGMETMGQVMVQTNVVDEAELARLQEETLLETQSPDFLGMLWFVSVWGRKPDPSEPGEE